MTERIASLWKNDRVRKPVLAALLFLANAALFWAVFGDICHTIGAITCGTPMQALVEGARMMPAFTLCAGLISLGFSALLSLGDERRVFSRSALITSAVLGAVDALWVIFGYLFSEYGELAEGFPTLLFPLDALLCGAALFAVCFLLLKKGANGEEAPRGSVAFRIFGCIAYLAALCGLAGFAIGLFTVDFTHGGIFYNIILLLCYLAAPLLIAAYAVVRNAEDPALRPLLQKNLSLGFLIADALLFVLYFIAVETQSWAPNQNAFSILPLEFTASVHAFPLIYLPVNLLSPLIAFLKIRKKQAK